MPERAIIHILNDDPIIGDIEKLPDGTDQWLTIRNPERRDGKPIPYLEANTMAIVLPIHRITFLELISGEVAENVVTHFKE